MSTEPPPHVAGLASELHRIADDFGGDCTWALTDLSTGAHIARDEGRRMPSASLIKVMVLVAVYDAVERGAVRLDDRVTYGPEHFVRGSGVLARMSYGVEMSVRDAATLMMIISDNAATNMCVDLAGLEQVNRLAEGLGLHDTRLYTRLGDPSAGMDPRKMNESSAADMTALLASIARHECVSPEASEDMLRIMRRCDYRHELSRELPWNELNMLPPDPKTSWVAEKGGAFIGVRCGGGVFKGPRGSFAMAAFTEGGGRAGGTGREAEGNVTLGRLGKAAWDALAR
jgi:beta-lactamase class A